MVELKAGMVVLGANQAFMGSFIIVEKSSISLSDLFILFPESGIFAEPAP